MFGMADIGVFFEATAITLTGWRAYSLYKLIRDFNKRKADHSGEDQQAAQPAQDNQQVPQPAASPDELEMHKVIHKEFMEWIKDIPYIPFALFSGLGFWRYSKIVDAVKTSPDNNTKRRSFVIHSGLILVDMAASAAVAVMMTTVWRAYLLTQALKKIQVAVPAPPPPPSNVHTLRSSQKKQSQPPKTRWQQLDEWHRVAFQQLGEWVQDIPYIPLFLPVLATIYRLVPLWRVWKACKTDKELRAAVVAQFKMLVKDILCIPLVILMLLTLWRSYSLFSGLTEEEDEEAETESEEGEPTAEGVQESTNTATAQKKTKKVKLSYHDVIFKEFLDFLVDIPYIIGFVMLGFRLPETIPMLIREKGTLKRRQLIASQFQEMVKDIPYIPMVLCLVVTVWRVPILFSRIRAINNGSYVLYKKRPANRSKYNTYIREEISYHFVALPRDILCLILGTFY